MKLNLFLSVASLFTILHICKAGPLRLQKRATFYIANETACVVDNIVYSSGDPIPTDDPCEACKCRPPGFACVLKDCKVKPGCRAVRHVGECCPEYICGCEHNGRFYQDGEEIRDPKNPCYECHCQGSSIACAFVECIFRNDCETEFVPSECCPKYINCTRDIHRNSFPEKNALPPINLLPALNDESVLLGDFPTTQAPESHKTSTDRNLSTEPTESNEEKTVPESEILVEIFNETAETKLENPGNDKSTEDEESKKKPENYLAKEDENKESDLSNDETEALLNSPPETKNNTSAEKDILKVTPTLEEQNSEEKTQTVDVNEIVENEAEITEISQKGESTSTHIPSIDQVKNSALEKGKSLKLSDDEDQPKDSEEKKVQVHSSKEENSNEKITTEFPPEASTQAVVSDTKETVTESELKSLENVAQESQTNSQSASFYNNNEKIKSETAETVTIVVHVNEKAKFSTETDLITDTITPESVTKETQEDVPKYNSEIQNIDNTERSSEVLKTESTVKNFEIFPTKNDHFKVESTTDSPITSLNLEETIKERSDEINVTVLKEENSENEKDGLHSQELLKTTTQSFIHDISAESTDAKENEYVEKEKTASTIEKDEIKPMGFEIITDSTELPKHEESVKASTEEIKLNKLEEASQEGREGDTKLDEIKPEEKVGEAKLEEKTEETKLDKIKPDKEGETLQEEKAEETKVDEIKPEEKTGETKLDEIQPEEKDAETKLKNTTEETKLEEKAKETKLEERAKETNLEEKAEETKLEEIKLEEATEEQNPEKFTPSENIHEASTVAGEKKPILTNVDYKSEEKVEITSSEYQETSTKTIEVIEIEKSATSQEEAKSQNQENEEPKQSEKSS